MGETGAGVGGRLVGATVSVGVGEAVGVAGASWVGEGDAVGVGEAVNGLAVGEVVTMEVGSGLDVAAGIGVDSWAMGVDPGGLEPPQPVTMVMSKNVPMKSL